VANVFRRGEHGEPPTKKKLLKTGTSGAVFLKNLFQNFLFTITFLRNDEKSPGKFHFPGAKCSHGFKIARGLYNLIIANPHFLAVRANGIAVAAEGRGGKSMPGNKISAEITTLLENKSRYLAFPGIARLGREKYMLMFHDAPAHNPAVMQDPESLLGTVTGPAPWAPDLKTRRTVPRFSCAGHSPSAIALSENRAMIIDNRWYIYNWLGEMDIRIIKNYDWTTVLRGAYAVAVDTSGEKPLFGKPSRITSHHYPVVSCYDTPIAVGESSLLCAVDYDGNCTQMKDKPWETVLMRTDDLGQTWHLHAEIAMEKNLEGLPRMHYPSVRQTHDGRLVCILSSLEAEPRIFITESEGDGAAWSKPRPAGFAGRDSSFIALSDGRLIAAYSDTRAPFGIKFRVSDDCGGSWPDSAESTVDESSVSTDCGWPRGIQTDDGSVFITYYIHRPSGARAIMGARFVI
jgi:hypothetical protein